jgi:hypothetical protein
MLREQLRVVVSKPAADDLGIREPGEPVEVLLRRQRLPSLREQLAQELAQERLVVRERAVEVEQERADRHLP